VFADRGQLRILATRELVADRRDEGVDVVSERRDLRRPGDRHELRRSQGRRGANVTAEALIGTATCR
jgi:hypothetical protein